jgi:hypothetical protein
MEKQSFVKKLHKSAHPTLGKIVLGAGILLAAGALILVFRQQSVSPTLTNQSTPPPTLTPAPTLNPKSFLLTPTPTLAPKQKAVYTFYIQATSNKTNRKGLGIKQSDTGKVFTVDIGTLVIVNFGRVGKFQVSVSSPQDIFKCVGAECLPHSSPSNAIFSSWVSHEGFATITVVEAN